MLAIARIITVMPLVVTAWVLQARPVSAALGDLIHTFRPVQGVGVHQYRLFGSSVASVGDFAIVGDFGASPGTKDEYLVGAGAVSVFDETGAFRRVVTSPGGNAEGGRFGWSLAPAGGHVLVGAPSEYSGDSGGFIESGRVHLLNPATGGISTTFLSTDASASQWFGDSVASNGRDHFVAAAPEDPSYYNLDGRGYLYREDGSAVPIEIPLPEEFYYAYYRTAVLEDRVLVSALSPDLVPEGVIHVWNIASGLPAGSITNPTPGDGLRFGEQLAADADLFAVSATSTNQSPGKVYVYDAVSSQVALTLTDPDAPTALFGRTIAISQGRLFVGEGNSVHLFDLSTGEAAHTYVLPSGSGSVRAIAGWGDNVLVGADNVAYAFSALPEPSTGALLACAGIFLFGVRRARKRRGATTFPAPQPSGRRGRAEAIDRA